MIAGRMRHRDSAGNEGLLTNGGVQWMTAGRGIDPLRAARAGRRPHGRLPAVAQPAGQGQDARAVVPRHPERGDSRVHHAKASTVRVIAGREPRRGGRDAARGRPSRCTSTSSCRPGATFEQALPAGHNAFVYVYRGGVKIAGTDVPVQRMAILANRRRRRRAHGGPDGDARAADRGQAAGRADRAVRAVRDEHATTRSSRRCRTIRPESSRRRSRFGYNRGRCFQRVFHTGARVCAPESSCRCC